MSLKVFPNSLEFEDNKFDMSLDALDRFVKSVLLGRNKNHKRRMVEKLQNYVEMYELLEDHFQNQISTRKIQVPDEIWLRIMTFLNYKDVFLNVSLASKHFYNLTHDSSIVKSIKLKKIEDQTKLKHKLQVLKRSKNIRHVDITNVDQSTNIQLEQVLKCNPKLKALNFYAPEGKDQYGCTFFEKFDEKKLPEKTKEMIKKYANQIETLEFDGISQELLSKEEYVALTNIPNLKCFKVVYPTYPFSSEEVLTPLAFDCKKLECITLRRLFKLKFVSSAFDGFFHERQNTLKRLRMVHLELLNENIFRNLSLCQNIEQLELEGCFMTYESLHSISQLPNLKTLKCGMITYAILEIANWPKLERFWKGNRYGCKSDAFLEEKFTDKCLKSLISNSPNIKSIHFDYPSVCNFSNKFLFEMCKETNVCISFGSQKYFEYSEYKNHIKKSPRQLEMETYICQQDIDVYEKYQNMKNEFSKWLNRDFPFFDCENHTIR